MILYMYPSQGLFFSNLGVAKFAALAVLDVLVVYSANVSLYTTTIILPPLRALLVRK